MEPITLEQDLIIVDSVSAEGDALRVAYHVERAGEELHADTATFPAMGEAALASSIRHREWMRKYPSPQDMPMHRHTTDGTIEIFSGAEVNPPTNAERFQDRRWDG